MSENFKVDVKLHFFKNTNVNNFHPTFFSDFSNQEKVISLKIADTIFQEPQGKTIYITCLDSPQFFVIYVLIAKS
jgi:hypothetical protein